jgi:type I restriction enzyme M protein
MLTGELRTKIDAVWNAFWSGGISKRRGVIDYIGVSARDAVEGEFLPSGKLANTLRDDLAALLRPRGRGDPRPAIESGGTQPL